MDDQRSGSRWEPTDERRAPTPEAGAGVGAGVAEPTQKESPAARVRARARRVPLGIAAAVTALALGSATGGLLVGRAEDGHNHLDAGFAVPGGGVGREEDGDDGFRPPPGTESEDTRGTESESPQT